MDPAFISTFCTHSLTARAATSSGDSMDEALGTARTLRGYYEKKTARFVVGSMGGAVGVEAKAPDVFVTPDACTSDDRFWRAGEDASDATLGRKAKVVEVFWDPTRPAVAGVPAVHHYEVEL